MITGITFTASYIIWFKFIRPELNTADHWLLGISPEGIGTIGMVINFAVAGTVAALTPPPPERIARIVDWIRIPRGAGEPHEIEF
jgi:cation/acetate symporter